MRVWEAFGLLHLIPPDAVWYVHELERRDGYPWEGVPSGGTRDQVSDRVRPLLLNYDNFMRSFGNG